MRSRNILSRNIFVMTIFLGLLMLVGCRPATESLATVTMSPLPTRTLLPTISDTPTSTPLQLTQAVTSTLAASTAPTISPTLKPTLTGQQLKEYAIEMLKNIGDCDLPCWWGITPGETELLDVKRQFNRAFVSSDGIRRSDGTTHYTAYFVSPPDSLEGYNFTLGFIVKDGLIQALEVRTSVDESASPSRFTMDWQHFSLDQVLSQYGQPTDVELQVKSPLEPNSPPSYLMWIVYENRGFWILYAGRSTYDGKIMHICPSLKMTFGLDLRLQSPESSDPVFQPEPGAGTRSLEEATGMSLEKFYGTFKNANEKACLDSASTLPQEP